MLDHFFLECLESFSLHILPSLILLLSCPLSILLLQFVVNCCLQAPCSLTPKEFCYWLSSHHPVQAISSIQKSLLHLDLWPLNSLLSINLSRICRHALHLSCLNYNHWKKKNLPCYWLFSEHSLFCLSLYDFPLPLSLLSLHFITASLFTFKPFWSLCQNPCNF